MSTHLKYIWLCACLVVSFAVYPQKESANWYFGEFAGLNFNSGNPEALTNGQLVTKEGCATISDPNGNLLFYTDGITVWDRLHQVMPNGTGLYGDTSSTASAIIIPKPWQPNIYYIFTVDKPSYFLSAGNPITGLNYSVVDMNLNNGMGDVIPSEKNIHLITYNTSNNVEEEYKCSEKITAVTHSNGGSIWVITQFTNKFYAFVVDGNGVNPTPVISTVQQTVMPRINEEGSNISAIGYLKVSPNGKKIAIAHSSTILGNPRNGHKKSGMALLYDFNNTTGVVSNQQTLLTDEYPYGVEFSPDSKKLYITSSIFDTSDDFVNSYLYQFNIEAPDIPGTKTMVNNSQYVAGALQLAIDGKIYRAGYPAFGNGTSLSVINAPNELGTACNYTQGSVYLEGKKAFLGLPPFIQSIFKYTFDFEFTCLGDNTHFYVTSEDPYDSLVWNFGDNTQSTVEDTYHTFVNPGVYNVSLTLSLNGVEYDPILKQVVISDLPEVMQETFDLVQCDSFDDDPNDGIATFNLENANGPLSLFTTDTIDVFYYHSIQQATDDVDNSNALDYIYTNQQQDEILYAKVTKANTACYSIASVRLLTTQSVNLETYYLSACDYDNSNTAEYNLDTVRQNIINSINLTNVTITFHESNDEAAIGANPLDNLYISSPRTIYVRAESDNACYGNGTLELELVAFPELEDQTLAVCPSEFPLTIDSGLDVSILSQYLFSWNTSENTNQIAVYSSGEYTLTVIDPIHGCENSLTVYVTENEQAQIADVAVNDYSATVVLTNSSGEFLFALDSENGPFQNNSTFSHVEPGFHTVYVTDTDNCSTVSAEFNVIGFPDFFTPNNDGFNDYWNILGLKESESPDLQIFIFDRYGKLLKSFNPYQTDGWDGTYNGAMLTPDDYWYYLKLSNGKEYQGHFTLKL